MKYMKKKYIEIDQVTALLSELMEDYSIEEIAVKVNRSFATVYNWARGKNVPSKGDWQLLLKIAEGKE